MNYNYWDNELYCDICLTCNYKISSTGWCCKTCWINKTTKYSTDNVNIPTKKEYFASKAAQRERDFINKKEYDILQIEPPKTENEIKKQYYKLCLKYHPDKGGSQEDFIKLNDAYNILIC
tara:strand:- start:364 stop:723 length:360 start_codon:yes stop_codon:yes gene_type:complete